MTKSNTPPDLSALGAAVDGDHPAAALLQALKENTRSLGILTKAYQSAADPGFALRAAAADFSVSFSRMIAAANQSPVMRAAAAQAPRPMPFPNPSALPSGAKAQEAFRLDDAELRRREAPSADLEALNRAAASAARSLVQVRAIPWTPPSPPMGTPPAAPSAPSPRALIPWTPPAGPDVRYPAPAAPPRVRVYMPGEHVPHGPGGGGPPPTTRAMGLPDQPGGGRFTLPIPLPVVFQRPVPVTFMGQMALGGPGAPPPAPRPTPAPKGVEFQMILSNLAAALPLGLGRVVHAAAAAAPMFRYAANSDNPGAMRAAAALGGLVPIVGAFAGAMDQARASVFNFAAAASPSSMSTFNSSMDLLSAKIGHSFVPVLDEASRTIQNAGDAWSDFAAIKLGKDKQGNDYTVGSGLGGAASAVLGITTASWALKQFGYDKPGTTNLELPFHAKSFGAGQLGQFGVGLQQASLESGAKQTQLQVLEEILKELQGHKQILTASEQHQATNRYGYGY